MSRLAQAIVWWRNQKKWRMYKYDIPDRHFEVLMKHKQLRRIQRGVGAAVYEMVITER